MYRMGFVQGDDGERNGEWDERPSEMCSFAHGFLSPDSFGAGFR
jgi:hypothetical protein